MKLPYIAVVLGILVGIAGVMLIPAQTDAGRALIFLIALLTVALLIHLGGLLSRMLRRPEK